MKKWWEEYKKLWTWQYIKKSLTSWDYWKEHCFIKLWSKLKEEVIKFILMMVFILIMVWWNNFNQEKEDESLQNTKAL